jgi:predicted AlkP superfamily phosphohydrolase/phosphomutase
MDEKHPKHRPGESKKHLERIHEYYRAFDAEIGTLLDRTGEDVSLFVVSDHGFGPVHRSIDFNTWLYEQGYLVLKKRPSSSLRRFAWRSGLTPQALMDRDWFLRLAMGTFVRLKRKRSRGNVDDLKQAHALFGLFLSFQDIDWSRTRAFSPFGFGQIRINVRGQWSQGCVSEGSEYDRTREEIIEKLRTLKDPDTGELVDGVVLTREEIYRGDFLRDAPDLFFLPVNGKYRPKSTGFSSKSVFSSSGWMTGIHKMNGVLIGRGKPLNRGQRLEGLRITDVFPSVLGLMGLVIPEDVDGRIPDRMFTEAFLQEHPVRWGAAPQQTRGQRLDRGGHEEEREVMDRLRSLGYLE